MGLKEGDPEKEGEGEEGERERNPWTWERHHKGAETSSCERGRDKQKPTNGHSTLRVRSSSVRLECSTRDGIRRANLLTTGTKESGSHRDTVTQMLKSVL